MVINVACGPMAYKTQLLAYHYHLCRKPIVDFCDGMKKSTRLIRVLRQLLKLFQPYVEMYHTSTILFGS